VLLLSVPPCRSAFLKALSKQLPPSNTKGTITYSGAADGASAGVHLGQLVQYVSQLDEHLAHLTVRETLEFVHDNATVDPALHGYPQLAGQHARDVEDTIR